MWLAGEEAESRLSSRRIAGRSRSHSLFDPVSDQPAVSGIRGQEAEDHSDLHDQPIGGVVRSQMRVGEEQEERQPIQPNKLTSNVIIERVSDFSAAITPPRNAR